MHGGTGFKRAPVLIGTGALVLVAALAVSLVVVLTRTDERPSPTGSVQLLGAAWDEETSVSANGIARGTVRIAGDVRRGTELQVSLANATFARLPAVCVVSAAKDRHSWVSGDGRTLHCELPEALSPGPQRIEFTALTDDVPRSRLGGAVTLSNNESLRLADRPITVGVPAQRRIMRTLSTPDFFNGDVGDLGQGALNFDPATDTNSIDESYQRSLDMLFSDWSSKRPDDVMVAGDLVNGHWNVDGTGREVFGQVDTFAHTKAAILRAGALYYGQWQQRFDDYGLPVHPAIGDHEYGDNDWPRRKIVYTQAFRDAFANEFTTRPDGSAVYPDRPRGSQHEFSAYAYRPKPSVQVVSLDVFTRDADGMHLRVDPAQLEWLEGVLRRANQDGVRWTIVQGHVPILEPVRMGQSSGLSYEGGAASPLWRVFKRYGVDVYLCGEVHDDTLIQRDGIVQISHGGIFHAGRTNYLLADVYPTHIDFKNYDYDLTTSGGRRLFQTRSSIPEFVDYKPDPFIIGTAQLWANKRLTRASGSFAPYTP